MKSTSGKKVLRASDILAGIIPSTKLTSQCRDKHIVIRNVDLGGTGLIASIPFDRNVTVVQAQVSEEAAVVSAANNPVITLYNNDLATSVGTINIDKAAAQFAVTTIGAITNANIAAGHVLNASVTTKADTSGKCTLKIVVHEND